MSATRRADQRAPIGDALYVLKQMGLAGAKRYVTGLLLRNNGLARGETHWRDVLAILEDLDANQTREYLVTYLVRRGAA